MIQFGIDCGLFVLIWIVQLIIYPSFKYWQKDIFVKIHAWYKRMISIIVVPLMLGQAGYSILDLIYTRQTISYLRFVFVALVWVVTFFVSVPIHRELAKGLSNAAVERLINTNWIRTFLWSSLVLIWLYKIV